MAAELVGTAYVRIRAVTAGLAADIKDGIDKGVKDADVDKAGEKLGVDLGEGASSGLADSMADGVGDALDAPAVHKASEDGGKGVAKDVADAIEDENRRKNPFASMLDALKRLSFKDVLRGKTREIDRDLGDSFRDMDLDLPDLDFDFDVSSMEREAEDAGEKVGDATTRGITKSHKRKNPFSALGEALGKIDLPKPIAWAGIFGPTTLAPIIGTLLSALALITQALGFIVVAAAGAGVALAAIGAAALPGFAALFAAFKTQTKQLEKFKETAKKLLKPWQQFGAATQEFLLPGIEAFLEAVQLLIPQFIDFGRNIGEIFGSLARFAGETLTSEKNMRALGGILEASEVFFQHMGTAAIAFIDMLLPFLAWASPLATQFAESVALWAQHLAEVVNLKAGTGELATTFQSWYDKFVLLVGIIGDVLVGLWGILSIAAETGTPFFDKIAEAAQKFRDWVTSAEGENKIRKFFEDAQPVLDEIWRLLGNVYNLIIAPAVEGDGGAVMFSNLATALDLLNDVLENPITATVVPYLLGLVVATSLLSQIPTPILKGVGDGLWWISKGIAGIVQAAAGGAFKGVMDILTGTAFGAVAAPLLAIAAAVALVYLAFQKWDEWVMPVLRTASDLFERLSPPLQVVAGYLGTLLLVLNPIAWAVAIAGFLKNWDAIVAKLKEIGDAVKEFIGFDHLKDMVTDFAQSLPGLAADMAESLGTFFTETLPAIIADIPRMLGEALGALGDFFGGIGEVLAPFASNIGEFFAGIPGKIKDALITGLENLPNLLLDALAGMFDLGQNLLGLIADGVMYAVPRLYEFFVGLPGDIIRILGQVLPELLSIGVQVIGFILNGVTKAGPKILFFFLRLPFEILTLLRKGLVELAKLGLELIAALFRGVVSASPRIMQWFADLPGNLLSMLTTALSYLLELGGKIITGIFNGITNNAGAVFDWFVALPGVLLGLLGDVLSILWQAGGNLITGFLNGIQALFGSVDEFFYGIPQRLLDIIVSVAQTIIDLGGKIPGWILEGITSLAQTLWDWFTGLPQAIFDLLVTMSQAVIDIGGAIIGWVVDGITGLWSLVSDWVTEFPQNFMTVFDFVKDKISDVGGAIIGWVVDGIKGLWSVVSDWVSEFPENFMLAFEFYTDKITDIGGTIIGWVVDGFEAIWDWVTDFPENFMAGLDVVSDQIIDIGGAILDWIIEGLADLASEIGDALQGAMDSAVRNLNPVNIGSKIVGGIGGLFGIGAEGGVFQQATPMIIGEAGTEALIPVTRPARALALMQQTGLDRMVLNAYAYGAGGTISGKTVAGETTMLHIDQAIMTAPVDADMLVSKVTAAYNRLAS